MSIGWLPAMTFARVSGAAIVVFASSSVGPLVAPRGWVWVGVAFVLFRIFDVVKPWPASWADRSVKGGFGAMLDDVIAGAYAALALALALRFVPT